eukprot:1624723-Prymnesium_polylepis.2
MASDSGKFGTSNAADWYTFDPLRGFKRVAICCANSITYLSRATTQKPNLVAILTSASICGSRFCTGAGTTAVESADVSGRRRR